MQLLKQSTAATLVIGPFVDDADGKTAETGLTISQSDVLLHKSDGTSIAQKNDATSATHRSSGYYTVPLNSTDTGTLGRLRVMVSESGALPVFHDFMVVPAVVYDSLVGGTDYLQVDAVQVEGSDATNQIRDSVVDDATRIDASALNTLSSHDPGENIMGATDLGTGSGLTSLASADNLAAVKAKTDNLPADPADDSDIDAQLATIAGYLDTEVAAILAAVDTEVAAIKAKTDQLNFSGTDVKATLDGETVTVGTNNDKTGYALTAAYDAAKTAASQSSVNTVAGYIDTEVAAILAAVDTEVAAIKTVTDAIGATGTGLTAIPWNSAWDAEVQSECTDALNAYDPPTHTEMTSAFSTTNGKIDAVDDFVDTEVAAVLAAVDTEVAAIKAKTDNLPANTATVLGTPAGASLAADIATLVAAVITNAAGTDVSADVAACKAILDILKIIMANKSIENESGTIVTYRNDADNADAGSQSWTEATKTRGAYTPA